MTRSRFASRVGRRRAVVVASCAAVVALAGVASASWLTSRTANGTAGATSVQAVANASVSLTVVSSTEIDVKVVAVPAGGPTPSSYLIKNGTTTVCATVALNATCQNTGLAASTQYTYNVFSNLNNWVSAGSATASSTTQASASTSVSALTISNKNAAPAGTAGKMDSGDKITITFSAAIKASTVCSAWSDTGNQTSNTATVRVVGTPDDNGNDALTVNSWSGCSTFRLGSIGLGSPGYQTSTGSSNKPVDFTSSTIAYDASAHTLTITLGTVVSDSNHGSVGSAAVTSSVATWTVDAGIKDANNAAINPSTKVTANVQQF